MYDADRIPVTLGVLQRGFTERGLPDTPVACFGSATQNCQYIVVVRTDGGGIAMEKIEYAVPLPICIQVPGQFPRDPGPASGMCGQNSRFHQFAYCSGSCSVPDLKLPGQCADGGDSFAGRIFPGSNLLTDELFELCGEFFSHKFHMER